MKRIKCRIKGITPLLMNAFTDAEAMASTNGNRSSAVGERGKPREQAELKLYLDEETGKPIIPQPNLFRCIMDAGKFFKTGRSKVTTQKSSQIPACLGMDDLFYFVKHGKPWEVDSRPCVIPATGGRIIRHRPRFDDWEIEFQMELDTELMSEDMLRSIVDAAGKRIGLGDFRPDRKGPFGKFVVTHWDAKAA